MTSTDPIADMLTTIRNAVTLDRRVVSVPASQMKLNVLSVLKDAGFIKDFAETGEGILKKIEITIAGEADPINITEIKRLSRPGRRLYSKAHEIPVIKNGRGIAVVSTSKGLLNDSMARDAGLGGELICSVF